MADQPKLAAIVPTYSDFPYSLRCLETLTRNTQDFRAFVLDDGSPEWGEDLVRTIERIVPDARIHHFPENGGLTRSWNEGLRRARAAGAEYSALVNSDTLVGPGWFEAIEGALGRLDLVGPVSNAPGHREIYGLQLVNTYLPDYELTDDPDAIARTALRLRERHGPAGSRRVNTRRMKIRNRFRRQEKLARRVNGFFMVARTTTWWENAYDAEHVFDPSRTLIGAEDEFQKRFTGRIGIALSSFVFHYRSASRGLENVDRRYSHGAYRSARPLSWPSTPGQAAPASGRGEPGQRADRRSG